MKQNSQICGTDLFLYAGIKLHIIFGYYSHFPEMALLGNATAKHAISQKKINICLLWNTKCDNDLINMVLEILKNHIILNRYVLI